MFHLTESWDWTDSFLQELSLLPELGRILVLKLDVPPGVSPEPLGLLHLVSLGVHWKGEDLPHLPPYTSPPSPRQGQGFFNVSCLRPSRPTQGQGELQTPAQGIPAGTLAEQEDEDGPSHPAAAGSRSGASSWQRHFGAGRGVSGIPIPLLGAAVAPEGFARRGSWVPTAGGDRPRSSRGCAVGKPGLCPAASVPYVMGKGLRFLGFFFPWTQERTLY